MELKTEYEFILPRGYVDKEGNLHREGVMRLANAKDEVRQNYEMLKRNDPHARLAEFSARFGAPTKLGEGYSPGGSEHPTYQRCKGSPNTTAE